MRRLMRNRMLAGFVAVAVLVPSVVLATHTWPDVPDGRFYTAAVEWAQANGMTTGCDGGTNFCPDRGVSRAENLTYAKRYDDLVVQPALAAIRQSPDRVVWVADDGSGDFLLLSAALASINDASASNPYLVRIAPGEYTETATVALKTYVDVEGSGQGVTTITCACASDSHGAQSATVSAGNIATEIRNLTIITTGDGTRSYGVYNYETGSLVSMTDVTVVATGGTYSSGVYNYSSTPSMANMTAGAGGSLNSFGVYNYSSSPSMTDVDASAGGGVDSYGVYNYDFSNPLIRNSRIAGDNSIYNDATSSAQVVDTMLDGIVTEGIELACVGAYDANFVALDEDCAVIP